jgi:hypothetical protein
MNAERPIPDTEAPPVFEDRVLHCVECGQTFFFFASEARIYHARALFQPKRCPYCRAERKAKAAGR